MSNDNQKKDPLAGANDAAAAKAAAEKAAKEAADKAAAAKKPYPYSVAEGTSLTSKKGILDAGAEVKVEYFAGGKETLANLVKKGHVVKAK